MDRRHAGQDRRGNYRGNYRGKHGERLEPRAFVWDATNGIRDLNDLILGGGGIGLTLTNALAVSDRGDILAVRQGQDGASYFLLTEQPLDTNSVPAPAAFALVLAALPILGYRRFRQPRVTS